MIKQWHGQCQARRDGALGLFHHAYRARVSAETRDDALVAFIAKAHKDGWEPMAITIEEHRP